nr:hypothetical protein [uncultured bacterium]
MIRIPSFLACCALSCLTSGIAFAQLTDTTMVTTRLIAPPSGASGWTDIAVDCPAGLNALSGGVSSDSSAVVVTTSAPRFNDASLFSQLDGVRGPATGWYASVKNLDANATHPVVLTAVCGLMPGIVVSINSTNVSAAAPEGPGIGVLIAQCPANYSAIGGGIDTHLPGGMFVTSSSPTFGAQYLADRPIGQGGAPTGWNGGVRNQGNAIGLMKVAAVCTPSPGVSSVVSAPFFAPSGQAAGSNATCPAGTLALSGGIDSPFYTTSIITSSTPLINGSPQPFLPIDRPAGSYTSAVGWYGIYSNVGINSSTARVAAVCAAVSPVYTVVYEFFNSTLKHYFRTASTVEAAAIDNGAAGPGWIRTGDNFYAYVSTASTSPGSDVCRFYSSRSNSHFYTGFASECASLKAANSGWNYEGVSFRIPLPTNNSCVPGTKPVYRLYNNRAQFNDTNHRFTTDFENVAPLQRQGWTYEGVGLCALVL